jgi:predicted phosphohydrolase
MLSRLGLRLKQSTCTVRVRTFATNSIQIVSDLHTEFYKNSVKLTDFINVKSPNLALLGDIGNPNEDSLHNYERIISDCNNLYKNTFILSGNHEYYKYNNKYKLSIEETDNKIKTILKKYPNVHFLQNNYFVLGQYVVAGTTLWSDVSSFTKSDKISNDYNQIYGNNGKLISPEHILKLYKQNVTWLQHIIEYFKYKQIIIMTHHMPTFKLVDPKYANHPATVAFASNIEHIYKDNVKFHFCGHSHKFSTCKINNCDMYLNPYGYRKEHLNNKKYIDIVVEL